MPVVQHLARGRRRVLLTSAGDRPDSFVIEAARAVAGHFDDYIMTDWHDLRGRAEGEIPSLLARALASEGVPTARIQTLPLPEATKAAVLGLKEGDLLFSNLYPVGL